MRLTDKTAIIVGAGQSPGEGMGNGRATALRVRARGRQGAGGRPQSRLGRGDGRRWSSKEGGTCVAFAADVTKEATLQAAVAEAMRLWGRIDILHNNVGVSLAGGDAVADSRSPRRPSTASSAINLRGIVMACKHVLPIMRQQQLGLDHQHLLDARRGRRTIPWSPTRPPRPA